MREPLVSVNIPAYNAQDFIERTILSALNQTHKNIEVIVLDDGSTDKTGDVVEKLQKKDSRVRYYYQENQGLSPTRNRLFDLSKGEYIAFLDHDDEWLPEKIELQLLIFKGRPELGLVFGRAVNHYEDGRRKEEFMKRSPRRGKVFYEYLLSLNFIPLCSAVVRKDVLKKYMPFKPWLRTSEEWELFLRLGRDYEFDYIDRVVAIYHVRKDGLMRRSALREAEEVLSILDYWSKEDAEIMKKYRRRLLEAKSRFNYYRYNFFKENHDYKNARRALARCISMDPGRLSHYLRLIRLLFLMSKQS
ncbi:glycosyltransferase family 2 protein [Candidatus Omnitrophota bacterium]